MSYRSLFLAAVAACCVASQAPAAVIYSNDFSANTNNFTLAGTTFDSGTGNRVTLATNATGSSTSSYLGRISTGTATLNLTGLIVGKVYNVSFDLYIGGSWDGNNGTFGPDIFKLTADANTLVNTNFSNMPEEGGANQTYTDSNFTSGADLNNLNPSIDKPAGTGADVLSITNSDIYSRYAIYYFGHGAGNPNLSFTATATTATLVFSGIGLQAPYPTGPDEFWALDNVIVADIVPVPGNLVMLGSVAAFGFMGTMVRRIRRKS